MTALRHTWQVFLRYMRALLRQPAWVVVSLVQPVIWLLLFGGLFKRVVEIPGFHAGSYIEFLTPGVVVLTAVSSAGWTGMGFIEDINRGVMDRFLVSPVWRGGLNAGSIAQACFNIAVQGAIIVALAYAVGAYFRNGVGGAAIFVAVAALLGACFASLSNGLAVIMRQREGLIGAVTTVTLPSTFISSAFMQQNLAPHWIQWLAKFNPVNWAVQAGRSAATQHVDWGLVGSRIGLLALLLLACATFATRAFGAYQRSV